MANGNSAALKYQGPLGLCYDGPLTLARADAIGSELVAAIADGVDIEVDCAGAERVDVSFIQLIVAARQAAQANGTSLTLRHPAAGELLNALRRGGFVPEDGQGSDESRFWMKEDV